MKQTKRKLLTFKQFCQKKKKQNSRENVPIAISIHAGKADIAGSSSSADPIDMEKNTIINSMR